MADALRAESVSLSDPDHLPLDNRYPADVGSPATSGTDSAYGARLCAALANLGPEAHFSDVVRQACGMFPVEVDRWLRQHSVTVAGGSVAGNIYQPPRYDPELHPLDGEWYFTDATSDRLAELSATGGGGACLLGVPTVAAKLDGTDSLLVDHSPFLRRRFPDITLPMRVAEVRSVGVSRRYASVLLDPPWYLGMLYDWLGVAGRSVSPGGRVIFPLLGELTRPSAYDDRQAVLEFVESAGRVTLLKQAVEYDIPLFEHRALGAAGLTLDGPWRRADLVVVDVRRPFTAPPARVASPADSDRWLTFVLGAQVVKLRRSQHRAAAPIASVPGVPGDSLDSVSRRDPRREQIDIWTSRNRVARVGDFPAVRSMLSRLSGDEDGLVDRARTLAGELGPEVEHLLRLIEVDL